jgi:anti-sigma-K factor RskA
LEVEDIKAYIESGVLELYILGDVTHKERLEVEEMAVKHPAVKAELDEIERSMELYAANNAVEPSEHIRERILGSILTNFGNDDTFKSANNSVQDNVIAFRTPKAYNFYKYAFAACLALLLMSVAALVSVNNKLQNSSNQIAALQSDKQHFVNQVNYIDKELKASNLEVGVFRDASFKFLKLKGTPHTPAAALTIAWSPQEHKVMVDLASAKMPQNDKNHQYQLWAIVAGKPVGLGVFDANPDSTDMKEMKTIAAVSTDAFAVTLEPRGGSEKPTMDQMVVLGKF